MATTIDRLQALNGFLQKSDGKDKLTALIQYACMFLSAGEPGNIKKIQTSVTAARKIFRVMRPFESVMPIITQPGFTGKQHPALEALVKVKSILMAIYFGADHVVWAYQIGLVNDKELGERFQKLSLYSWAVGSLVGTVADAWQIVELSNVVTQGSSKEDQEQLLREVNRKVNERLMFLSHGLVQAALAAGLLQLLPWKPRTVGLLGVIASAMNCYFLMPSLPKRPAGEAGKAKTVGTPVQEAKLVTKVA